MRVALAISLAAAACSVPAEKQLSSPLGCVNAPPPTTAAEDITITGTTIDPFTGVPVSGVQLVGSFQGVMGTRFMTTSDSSGQYTAHVALGGEPRQVSMQATAGGYLVATVYPAEPVIGDAQVDPQMSTMSEMMNLGSAAGLQLDASDDQILVQVVDCNGVPLGGATVSSQPAGTVVYFDDTTPAPTATMTDSKRAVVFLGNVPASNTQITAMRDGMVLGSVNVDPNVGGLIQAAVQP